MYFTLSFILCSVLFCAVVVVVPTDRTVRQLIHRTIEFVVREGPEFEDALIRRVGSDSAFRFLTETDNFEHTYYRWKVRL